MKKKTGSITFLILRLIIRCTLWSQKYGDSINQLSPQGWSENEVTIFGRVKSTPQVEPH